MNRFFFDIADKTRVEYDFCGRELEKVEQACELAELIALDLVCKNADKVAEREVQVRNISGTLLYSFPLRQSDLLAA